MNQRTILRIAAPVPIRKLFDYLSLPNQTPPPIGSRVKISFGNRSLIGVVLDHPETSNYPIEKLRPIEEILDHIPLLPEKTLSLLKWASEYYHYPLGEAIAQALPKFLRIGKALQSYQEHHWTLTPEGHAALINPKTEQRAPTRFALLSLLSNGSTSEENLLASNIKRTTLRDSEKKAFIKRAPKQSKENNTLLLEAPLPLSKEQQKALSNIQLESYHCTLLEGVTGSGKTEIYLRLAEQWLKQRKQVLILVPEIGLTPQTLKRFQSRFRCTIAHLHSGLSDGERAKHWLQCSDAQAQILIGTRSSVFTPMPNLGGIIIDEEHDNSYKQQDSFRYSARDLAIYRAQQENTPIILGSATPSIETLFSAETGRFQLQQLLQRPNGSSPPQLELINLNHSPVAEGISSPLTKSISQTLSANQQVLLFINRRGYAPAIRCDDCGWIAECQHCSAKMTLHNRPRHLQCHHCENRQPLPKQCPSCNSKKITPIGQGTEKQEEQLEKLFPNVPVIRIDRDSTARKGSMAQLCKQINQGDPCIIIGTQMLAKGHHFPKVTLVGILDIDSSLFSGDFRAAERSGQLITQVQGRSGRSELPGRVILQTNFPEHPFIRCLQEKNYRALCELVNKERQLASMPPYSYIASIRCSATSPQPAQTLLAAARHNIQILPDITLMGPWPCLMEKRQGRFRFEIVIKSISRASLHQQLFLIEQFFEQQKYSRDVRWHIDVDPQDMS